MERILLISHPDKDYEGLLKILEAFFPDCEVIVVSENRKSPRDDLRDSSSGVFLDKEFMRGKCQTF